MRTYPESPPAATARVANKRNTFPELHLLCVFGRGGGLVGYFAHPNPAFIDAKESEERAGLEAEGFTVERVRYVRVLEPNG